MVVAPEHSSGDSVDSDEVAWFLGNKHHSVDDERGGLCTINQLYLVVPLELEVVDVVDVPKAKPVSQEQMDEMKLNWINKYN